MSEFLQKQTLILGSVEEILEDILGTHASQIIFDHLENRCNLKKDEIPVKMEEFKIELQKLLGDATKIIIQKIEQNTKV